MRGYFALTGFAAMAVGVAVAAGCKGPHVYPEAPQGKQRDNVLGAVEEVVKARYPMAARYEKSDSVFALGPVETLGVDRTRKQIQVWVRKNYTGHWEPEVVVQLLVQVNEPHAGASDPSSPYITIARPVGSVPEWQALQRLSGEEQELYAAIDARLNG